MSIFSAAQMIIFIIFLQNIGHFVALCKISKGSCNLSAFLLCHCNTYWWNFPKRGSSVASLFSFAILPHTVTEKVRCREQQALLRMVVWLPGVLGGNCLERQNGATGLLLCLENSHNSTDKIQVKVKQTGSWCINAH